MSDQELKDAVAELWEKANTHCCIMFGEWVVVDYEGDDVPPPPDDLLETIKAVTKYLHDSCG